MPIWRRKPKRPLPDPEVEEAKRRLAEATRDLEAAKADTAQVDVVARQIRELRRRNRFGQMIYETMRPAPRPRNEP